jgi:hypothetical protein
VCTFTLASNRYFKQDANLEKEVGYFDVESWEDNKRGEAQPEHGETIPADKQFAMEGAYTENYAEEETAVF